MIRYQRGSDNTKRLADSLYQLTYKQVRGGGADERGRQVKGGGAGEGERQVCTS